MVKDLLQQGEKVRACDLKPFGEWFQKFEEAENLRLDLRDPLACRVACAKVDEVFNLAADMGGMGYIETNKAKCMLSVLINTNLLIAARDMGVKKYFFSSSACVYPLKLQNLSGGIYQKDYTPSLSEEDAYPADCEDGYGWEKLFSERMCRHFREDFGLTTVVARYHNVYGPNGTWQGGREKAPAAICRKVIEAKLNDDDGIEIWGNGQQTRSFMYIDDCVKGTQMLMEEAPAVPVNLGSSELISILDLARMIMEIAGINRRIFCDPSKPKGVNGRNSDNTLIKQLLNWEPSIQLREGLEKTYAWIYQQMTK